MTGQQIQIIGGAIIYAMYAQTVNTNRCPEESGEGSCKLIEIQSTKQQKSLETITLKLSFRS